MADNEEWSDQTLEKIITEASSSFYPNNSFPFSENDLQLNKANKNYTSHDNIYRVRSLLDEQAFPISPIQSPNSFNQLHSYFDSDSLNSQQPYNPLDSLIDPNEEEGYSPNYAQQQNHGDDDDIDEYDADYSGTSREKGDGLTKNDKRKRNTAASARFRIKKKMKEQELQKIASEMTEKASKMEGRVHELEREIKWLKALVVEKSDARLQKLVHERPNKDPFYFNKGDKKNKK